DNFWTKKAYLIPDTPHADITPGQTGVSLVPINRMNPRSFVTNLEPGAHVATGKPAELRGIAFGGDCGVAHVDVSMDSGRTWQAADLAPDEGKYGFRRWSTHIAPPAAGNLAVMVRCTNTNGDAQPDTANWNGNGFMRNVIEPFDLVAV